MRKLVFRERIGRIRLANSPAKGLEKIYETTGPGRETTGQELLLTHSATGQELFLSESTTGQELFLTDSTTGQELFLTDSTTGQ